MHFVVRDVSIVDPIGEEIRIANVEIMNGRIISTESNAETVDDIDGRGKYLIAGLVDMHTHISPVNARHYLTSGVTAVRNTAGNFEMIGAIDELSPEIHPTYRMIDGDPGLWGETSMGHIATNDVAEALEGVGELHEQGAKFIKVYGNITEEVLEAVVNRAEEYNLEVAADFIHSRKIDSNKAARAGVKWLEHASSILQSLYPGFYAGMPQDEFDALSKQALDKKKLGQVLQNLKDNRVKLVPTLTLYRHLGEGRIFKPGRIKDSEQLRILTEDDALDIDSQFDTICQHITEEYRQREKWAYDTLKKVTKRYLEMDGEVYIGTDAPAGIWTYNGIALIEEMMEFGSLGLSNFEVLKKATIEAYQAMDYGNKGLVAAGFDADLVLLKDNPADSLENLLQVDKVIKSGRVLSLGDIENHTIDTAALESLFNELTGKYAE